MIYTWYQKSARSVQAEDLKGHKKGRSGTYVIICEQKGRDFVQPLGVCTGKWRTVRNACAEEKCSAHTQRMKGA